MSMDIDRISRIADRICLDVAELPDRTSPNDWPDAMLDGSDEKRANVFMAIRDESEREKA